MSSGNVLGRRATPSLSRRTTPPSSGTRPPAAPGSRRGRAICARALTGLLALPALLAPVTAPGPAMAQAVSAFQEYSLPAGSGPAGIGSSPDQPDAWLTNAGTNSVRHVDQDGNLSSDFGLPSGMAGAEGISTTCTGGVGYTPAATFTEFQSSRIGTVSPSGAVIETATLTPDAGPARVALGAGNGCWFTEFKAGRIGQLVYDTTGTQAVPTHVQEYPLPLGSSGPLGLTAGPDGRMWFTEPSASRIGVIAAGRSLTDDLQVNEYPLPAAGSQPEEITAGADGNLWFTEAAGNRIGRITTGGVITEFPSLTAGSQPQGITLGADGNVWFTETAGNRIGRITTGGTVTEFSVPTAGAHPTGIAGGQHDVWFTETGADRIGRVSLPVVTSVQPSSGPTLGGTVVTVSGSGFDANTTVSFGSIPALGVTVASPSSLTAISPPRSGDGPVDVVVSTRFATSGSSGADLFTYYLSAYTVFPQPNASSPSDITQGPDGNLWFASGRIQIARLTPAGAVTQFDVPNPNQDLVRNVTAGPDGNLWFTIGGGNYQTSYVGRMTPAGSVTGEFTVPTQFAWMRGMTAAADGNLWYTAQACPTTETCQARVGRVTPAGIIQEYPLPSGTAYPMGITSGPDGNVWFTEEVGAKIGRITPAGDLVAEFPLPDADRPARITTGPDGGLWFTTDANVVGRITTAGSVQLSPTAGASAGIVAGPDGNLWFSEPQTGLIGRLTTAGTVTEFLQPPPPCTCPTRALGIAPGPGRTLWVTDMRDAANTGWSAVLSISFPSITAVSPSFGPAGGGTGVTLSGSGLGDATGPSGVLFGSRPAASYTVSSPTSITAVSPPSSGAAQVDVFVNTLLGANPAASAPRFSYGSAATPPTAPAAPSGVQATAGNAAAFVSWTAPDNGGAGITSYTITPLSSGTPPPATTLSGSPPRTWAVVSGLSNGTTYSFSVSASNAVGAGPPSASSNPVTPQLTPHLVLPPPIVHSGDASAVRFEGVRLLGASTPLDGGMGVCEAGPVSTTGSDPTYGSSGVPSFACSGSSSSADLEANGSRERVGPPPDGGAATWTSSSTATSLVLLPRALPGGVDLLSARLLDSQASASCPRGAPHSSSSVGSLTIAGLSVATRPVGSQIVLNPLGGRPGSPGYTRIYGSPIVINPTGSRVPMAIVTLNSSRYDPAANSEVSSPVVIEFPARGPLAPYIVGRIHLSYTQAGCSYSKAGGQ